MEVNISRPIDRKSTLYAAGVGEHYFQERRMSEVGIFTSTACRNPSESRGLSKIWPASLEVKSLTRCRCSVRMRPIGLGLPTRTCAESP